jgi:sec-independent protein translocase protein TatC
MSSATTSTDATPGQPTAPPAPKRHDPEDFRMSIGEHLDELRRRLFLGAMGFILAFIFWMVMGTRAVEIFCRPLIIAFKRNHLPPQIYFTEIAEPFMVYIRVSMILAFATASPWLLYQVWQFIAAGLYPNERKYVTKYLPLSITLLVSGMVFLYFYVLPLMLEFFLIFHIAGVPKIGETTPISPGASTEAIRVPILPEDPKSPPVGALWFDASTGTLKFKLTDTETRIIAFGSAMLTTPIITLSTYIDMVIGLLLSFGLAFQMPLAVLALNKIGIMPIEALKQWRRVVYFAMTILAACIVPDVATGMITLLIPLILLYELGILLAQWSATKAQEEKAA